MPRSPARSAGAAPRESACTLCGITSWDRQPNNGHPRRLGLGRTTPTCTSSPRPSDNLNGGAGSTHVLPPSTAACSLFRCDRFHREYRTAPPYALTRLVCRPAAFHLRRRDPPGPTCVVLRNAARLGVAALVEALTHADVVIVVGTSSIVYLGGRLPDWPLANRHRSVIEVTPERTFRSSRRRHGCPAGILRRCPCRAMGRVACLLG